MLRAAALLAAVTSVGAHDCLDAAFCTQELTPRVSDVRKRILFQVQNELGRRLDYGPDVINRLDLKFEEQTIDLDLDVSANRVSVAKQLYYQMGLIPDVYWLFVTDSSGRFLGMKRPSEFELQNVKGMTKDTLIRTEISTAGTMEFFLTDVRADGTGGPAYGTAYTTYSFNILTQQWHINGMAITAQTDLFATSNWRWTASPTRFIDLEYGIIAMRRIDPRPITGVTSATAGTGVIGAAFNFYSLTQYLQKIAIPNQIAGGMTPLLVVDGYTNTIVASTDMSIIGEHTTNTTNWLVRQGLIALQAKDNRFTSSVSANWVALSSVSVEQTFWWRGNQYTVAATGNEYSTGSGATARFSVVIITPVALGYNVAYVEPKCQHYQTTAQWCMKKLVNVTYDARVRTLRNLAAGIRMQLDSTEYILDGLDLAWNVDNTAIPDLTSTTTRTAFSLHLQNILNLNTELHSLWYASATSGQYLGLVRPATGQVQRWECNGGTDSSTCGTQKYTWVTGGTGTALTNATDKNMQAVATQGYRLVWGKKLWTRPYVTSSNALVVSVVRKTFGTDFDKVSSNGNWAVSLPLSYINMLVSTVQPGWADRTWVIYLLDLSGNLLGSTTNETVWTPASRARNEVIRGTQKNLLGFQALWSPGGPVNSGWWLCPTAGASQFPYSRGNPGTCEMTTTFEDSKGAMWFIDYTEIQNQDVNVHSYDWILVAAVPESALYNLRLRGDQKFEDWEIMLCIVGPLLFVAFMSVIFFQFINGGEKVAPSGKTLAEPYGEHGHGH